MPLPNGLWCFCDLFLAKKMNRLRVKGLEGEELCKKWIELYRNVQGLYRKPQELYRNTHGLFINALKLWRSAYELYLCTVSEVSVLPRKDGIWGLAVGESHISHTCAVGKPPKADFCLFNIKNTASADACTAYVRLMYGLCTAYLRRMYGKWVGIEVVFAAVKNYR